MWTMLDSFQKIGGEMNRFIVDLEVDPTNNIAESALTPSVLFRKFSGGKISSSGTKASDIIFPPF